MESVLNKTTMNTLPADVNGNILKRLAFYVKFAVSTFVVILDKIGYFLFQLVR